ncbi:MAG: hypothetical protein H6905_01825 [Hyphomicrobiales bacterium]|nr:hypothetical protein [Hyphomicrobiales bacterium]
MNTDTQTISPGRHGSRGAAALPHLVAAMERLLYICQNGGEPLHRVRAAKLILKVASHRSPKDVTAWAKSHISDATEALAKVSTGKANGGGPASLAASIEASQALLSAIFNLDDDEGHNDDE